MKINFYYLRHQNGPKKETIKTPDAEPGVINLLLAPTVSSQGLILAHP
jgi:hypothetical protein